MQQSIPQVRNACEACHKRKQRCVIPDEGGSCLSCQATNKQCFFVPRLKAGRPPRGPRHESSQSQSSMISPEPSYQMSREDVHLSVAPTYEFPPPGMEDFDDLDVSQLFFDAPGTSFFDAAMRVLPDGSGNFLSQANSDAAASEGQDAGPMDTDGSTASSSSGGVSSRGMNDLLSPILRKTLELHMHAHEATTSSDSPARHGWPRTSAHPLLAAIGETSLLILKTTGMYTANAPLVNSLSDGNTLVAAILTAINKVFATCESILSANGLASQDSLPSGSNRFNSSTALFSTLSPFMPRSSSDQSPLNQHPHQTTRPQHHQPFPVQQQTPQRPELIRHDSKHVPPSHGNSSSASDYGGTSFRSDGHNQDRGGLDLAEMDFEFFLMLKQIDLHLTQARIGLSQLGKICDMWTLPTSMVSSVMLQRTIGSLLDSHSSML